jgi:stage IV sporulation protein FB
MTGPDRAPFHPSAFILLPLDCMGWEDRPYYRDRPPGSGNPFMWLMTGSVPLFTLFGIRVRAHAMLLLIIALVLLFGLGQGSNVQMRVQSMSILFLVILLHEFGHCFAARWTGGQADEILMTPLGGLAMTMARRRPWPTFVTVAGGPLVNVAICLVCGAGLYALADVWPLGPWQFGRLYNPRPGWGDVTNYLFLFYAISWFLLLFNLLPVFPLDGGQLLQSILWKPLGYYRSMMIALNVGLVGSVLMIMVGVASFGAAFGGLLLIFIGLSCLMNCIQLRQVMRAEGPWAFQDEDSMDYGASHYGGGGTASIFSGSSTGGATRTKRPSKFSKWSAARAKKRAQEEQAEQARIDEILAKVSAHGMHSLTWLEKRTLRRATERQRKRDLEMGRTRRG